MSENKNILNISEILRHNNTIFGKCNDDDSILHYTVKTGILKNIKYIFEFLRSNFGSGVFLEKDVFNRTISDIVKTNKNHHIRTYVSEYYKKIKLEFPNHWSFS